MIFTKQQQEEIEARARERARKNLSAEVESVRKEALGLQSWVDGKGGIGKLGEADMEEFRNRNSSVQKAGKLLSDKKEAAIDYAKAEIMLEMDSEPGEGLPTGGRDGKTLLRPDSLGELFTKSTLGPDSGTSRLKKGEVTFDDADVLKALMLTTAGVAPEVLRNGRFIMVANRAPKAVQLLPVSYTDQNAVKYMKETVFSNNAAERAEGAAMNEATLTAAEVVAAVQAIAINLPVTQEQLDDVSYIRSYIDSRLPDMILRRLSSQAVNGTGVAPNLVGIKGLAGRLTNARGADNVADALLKMVTRIYAEGDAEPDGILMSPNDCTKLRILKGGDGQYIFGPPSMQFQMAIDGIPITKDTAVVDGEAHIGDFGMYSSLVVRKGIEMAITDSHTDEFVKAILRIRAIMRAALVWYREAAFGTVTGLNV